MMGLIFGILFLTGCSTPITPIDKEEKNNIYYIKDSNGYAFYIDKETCVEYIYSSHGYFIPRLNSDGTLLLNEKCLKESE